MNYKQQIISEHEGAMKLDNFRKKVENNMGISFPSISASGGNAAIVHYHPTKENSIPISKD